MENKEEKPKNNWTDIYTDHEDFKTKLMRHLMSDIEMATSEVSENIGFAYSMDGIKIWMPENITWQLQKFTHEKLKFIEVIAQNLINSYGDITKEQNAFLNSPLADHNFTKKTLALLQARGCVRMGHLAHLRKEEVLKIKGFGKIALEEIRAAFFRQGCIRLFDNDTSPVRKYEKKPKYAVGEIFRNERETIEIKKVYPPGHLMASKKHYGYLIDSFESGDDNMGEHQVTALIKEEKLKKL